MRYRTGSLASGSTRVGRLASLLAGVAFFAIAVVPAVVSALTRTTTTYEYNKDGALTAITTEGPEGSETTYLTWDNFLPDADDPTSGTVRTGNGTLIGFGPSPGAASAQTSFEFDARDRLIGYSDDGQAYSDDGQAQSYEYYADGMLASASTDDDTLQFYFDKSSNAAVRNIHHLGSGLWSAYLNGARYLSDGTEQVLLSPRKDTSSAYVPEDEQLQTLVYDAFGAQSTESLPRRYDLRDSPFQYAREYRDPLSGCYYLRARWYCPDLPTFLSRDPMEHLNRYNYGGGNPVNNVDPGGTNIFHSLGNVLKEVNAALNRGVGGHFARFFLAPLLGPLQIAANPEGFWEAVVHNKAGIDIFLAIGVATEFIGGYADSFIVNQGIAISMGQRYLARTAADLAIGFGQTVTAARGHKHFDWNGFVAGAEMTLGTAGLWRGIGSLNIRHSFRLTASRAGQMVDDLDDNTTALVFRVKTQIPGNYMRPRMSPFQEWSGLGVYHERLIAVTKSDFYATEAVDAGLARTHQTYASYQSPADDVAREPGRLEFVGKVQNFHGSTLNKFLANPKMLVLRPTDEFTGALANPEAYNLFTNNCHDHAYAIMQSLGLRARSIRSYFRY